MEKLSVIVPVYNAAAYLRDALDSAVGQSLDGIEFICIDDGSTDDSLKILKEYAKKYSNITVLKNEKNSGAPGKVKNKGLAHAKGEYIGFMDADDYISPNYYEELYNNAKEYDADISSSSTIIKFSGNEILYAEEYDKECEVLDTPQKKEYPMIRSGSNNTKIYRKSFVDKYDLRCCEEYCIIEDNYFSLLAMALSNKIVLEFKTRYFYRVHSQSMTAHKRTHKDFNVFALYEAIDADLQKYIDAKVISPQYLSVMNEKKFVALSFFIQDCVPEVVQDCKDEIRKRFPVVADKMGLTFKGRVCNFAARVQGFINRKVFAS